MKNRNCAIPALALLVLAVTATQIHAQSIYTPYAFTNFAGLPGGEGNVDGRDGAARFNKSISFGHDISLGVAVDSASNVYVADPGNHMIRKITPAGMVGTLAGSAGQRGSTDGTRSAARFAGPSGVAVDSAGNVYVGDTFNYTIRKITPAGVVTTLAGSAGQSGSEDGTESAARFGGDSRGPSGVAVDTAGNVYVADTGNYTIRRITPAGVVTTLAGTAGQSGSADGTGSAARFGGDFRGPRGVAVDSAGNVYVADRYNSTIRKITPAGVVTTVAGSAGETPEGVTVDSAGDIYVADSGNNTMRKITLAGEVTTLAGSGESGSADGTGSAAQFSNPTSVAVDTAGNVYVADFFNSTIRKITPAGVVTTLAGTPPQIGSDDGIGNAARFFSPRGVALDSAGTVYVADTANSTIRKITPAGVVTTLAGRAGWEGGNDGTGNAARFLLPAGVAVDSAGNVYVADGDYTIRKITPAGMVTTLAGSAGHGGSDDGIGSAARFGNPCCGSSLGIAVDSADNVYVADELNHTIRKVTPAGVVTTLAGKAPIVSEDPWDAGAHTDGVGNAARFNFPYGVAVDSAGDIYVADTGNNTIRKITHGGVVTTLADNASITNQFGEHVGGYADGPGSAARFNDPFGVAVDRSGNVYVAEVGNSTIRKIAPDGVVTTLSGSAGVVGGADGVGSAAQFSYPGGVAVDSTGNIYVADSGNNRITKGTRIVISVPRFGGLSVSGGSLTATLSGLSNGSTVLLESSSDLRDWRPVQTNIVSGASLPISVAIDPATRAEFLRAVAK